MKCSNPQNTSGVSGVNSVAAKSNAIEVNSSNVVLCGVSMLSPCLCGVSPGLLPQFPLYIHVDVSVSDCVSLYIVPVIHWRPVRSVSCLSPKQYR